MLDDILNCKGYNMENNYRYLQQETTTMVIEMLKQQNKKLLELSEQLDKLENKLEAKRCECDKN